MSSFVFYEEDGYDHDDVHNGPGHDHIFAGCSLIGKI